MMGLLVFGPYILVVGRGESTTMAATKEVQETAAMELGTLLDAGDAVFVTLVAGDMQLAAHRAVLSARSPVFEAMFTHDTLEAVSGQVWIADVEGPVLRQLASYCYSLRPPQLPAVSGQLLPAADKYGLSDLKAACEQQLAAQLTVENAAAAAVLAVRHSCPSLEEAAVAFIRTNSQVMATEGWADAVYTQPEDVAEVIRLVGDTELSAPATKRRRPSPGTHHQHHSDCSQTPAAATAPLNTPPPNADAVSQFRRLSEEVRGRKLIEAAEDGTVGELRALLAAGADVGARGLYGITALHYAAAEGHVEAASCLVRGGAEVDARNIDQWTPLHEAAMRGHAAVVRLLLADSADHNARTEGGNTPLHVAARFGRAEVAAALLEGGADKWARNDGGQTPLDIAWDDNKQQLIDVLL